MRARQAAHRLLPLPLALMVLAIIASSLSSVPRAAVAMLATTDELSIGYPDSQAFFPGASSAWRFCPDRELVECRPPNGGGQVCLSAAQVRQAFAHTPAVLESLYPRFDIELRMESEADDSSEMLDQILRILFTEVAGYSIKHIWNPTFLTQVPRCREGKFDFMSEIWKTDYSQAYWQESFFPEGTDAECFMAGINGLIGQNGWYVDSLSVRTQVALAGIDGQPVALDFFRAYSTSAGIAGLEVYNATLAAQGVYGRGTWFVPPICQPPSTLTCGVAFGVNIFFERGVPQQQIVNFGWRVALLFPQDAAGNADAPQFAALIDARMQRQQQVLVMASNTLTYVSSTDFVTIGLPPSSKQCHADTAIHLDGIGPMDCNFRQQSLYKASAINTDSDKADAFAIFQAAHVLHEDIVDVLSHVKRGTTVPNAACEWVRNNTATWTSWFRHSTPRKHTMTLATSSATIIYALAGLFLFGSLCAHIFLFMFRSHPVVRRSSYLFNQLVVLGASLIYIALLLGIQPVPTLASCVSAQFVLSVGFSLFILSLIVKTYRILMIFSSRQLQLKKLPDSALVGYLALYASVDLLLVILWSAIDAPHPRLVEHSTQAYAFVYECSSARSPVFTTLIYLLRGIALLGGAFLAVRVRGVTDLFNESKQLGAIAYNCVIVSGIVLGVSMVASNSPETVVGTYAAGVALAVFVSLLIFVVPKVLAVMRTTEAGVGVQHKQVQGAALTRVAEGDDTDEDAPKGGEGSKGTASPPLRASMRSTQPQGTARQIRMAFSGDESTLPSTLPSAFPHSLYGPSMLASGALTGGDNFTQVEEAYAAAASSAVQEGAHAPPASLLGNGAVAPALSPEPALVPPPRQFSPPVHLHADPLADAQLEHAQLPGISQP